MRRHLTIAVALVACSTAAHAQQKDPIGLRGETGVSIYSNDDQLTVISPWAEVHQAVGGPVTIGAGWKADAISSASVDVISAATQPLEELRNEGSLEVELDWRTVRASAGYSGSVETDAVAHYIRAGGELDLFKRNLTLGLGYGLGLDSLGQSGQPSDQWRGRSAHVVDVTATQVLSKTTVGQVGYSMAHQSGLLSSPYRRVPVLPRDTAQQVPTAAQWVAERHPDTRSRHAFSLRLEQAFLGRLFLSASWRGYLDTWSMRSHTGRLGLTADVGGGFAIELSDRLYWQSRASFYRGIYTVNRDFITRDRRLTKQLSNIGRTALWFRRSPLAIGVVGELHWTAYDDFQAIQNGKLVPFEQTLGWVGQIGVSVEL